jgi:hypothetical protein
VGVQVPSVSVYSVPPALADSENLSGLRLRGDDQHHPPFEGRYLELRTAHGFDDGDW